MLWSCTSGSPACFWGYGSRQGVPSLAINERLVEHSWSTVWICIPHTRGISFQITQSNQR